MKTRVYVEQSDVNKLYVVWEHQEYDTHEVSYHKTKKGAYKYIMKRHYDNWELCGYVQPGSYDELWFSVVERCLNE